MAKILIGKDVSVYTVNAAGYDGVNASQPPASGASYTFLGRWESLEVTIDWEWFMATSSDAGIKERRAGPMDWKASLGTQTRGDIGSAALALALNNNLVYFTFQDVGSGKTWTCIGGIDTGSLTAGQEAWKDKLDIVNVGYVPTYQ